MVQVFICKVAGELRGESDEARNFRWITLEELHELLEKEPNKFYPMHTITLKKYLREKLRSQYIK
jgi:ADP-ribose pyrophosphatase